LTPPPFGNALALGRLTDQDFTIIGEGDHGRRGSAAFGIFDDLGIVTFHHGNAGVGGSEIDTDCLRHDGLLFSGFLTIVQANREGGVRD
jgi:NAD-specific glutamate dehydrogenase